MPIRTLALLFAALLATACSKEEASKDKEKAEGESAASKKSKGDDDDSTDKKKKKKDDDDGKGSDEGKKPSSDDDKSAKGEGTTGGDRSGKGSLVPEGTPVPPGCAPDPSGKLGAKPKLIASAGQPGASLAIWQKTGDADSNQPAAITISADGKCYVEYFEMEGGPGNSATLLGYHFEKNAIQAVTGTTESGGATFVGFKVTYTSGAAMDHAIFDQYASFYGYVHANGMPYSCAKIAGEKGDRCAMYQKPLVVQTSEYCKDGKGGGPPATAPAPTVKGLIKPLTPFDPSKTSASNAPSSFAPPSTSAAPSASAKSDEPKCDGTPWCSTSATMTKDAEHVYVRVAAGKPKACSGSVKAGDTWYFDQNAWKKR